jgi:hypothetical protein
MGSIKEKRIENERYSWAKKPFLPNSAVRMDSKEKPG